MFRVIVKSFSTSSKTYLYQEAIRHKWEQTTCSGGRGGQDLVLSSTYLYRPNKGVPLNIDSHVLHLLLKHHKLKKGSYAWVATTLLNVPTRGAEQWFFFTLRLDIIPPVTESKRWFAWRQIQLLSLLLNASGWPCGARNLTISAYLCWHLSTPSMTSQYRQRQTSLPCLSWRTPLAPNIGH